MATYPGAVPTDPTANDTLAGIPHHDQHASANAGLTKLGTGSSTPARSQVLGANGSGTTAWRYGEVVDIRDWNISGNTGNDDTTAIQNAINQVNGLGSYTVSGVTYRGGTLHFPTGNWWATSLTWASNVSLHFDGYNHRASASDNGAWTTRLNQIPSTSGHLIVIPKDVIGYGFYNVFLDGNKANQTAVNDGWHIEKMTREYYDANGQTLLLHETDGLWMDCHAQNFKGWGAYTSVVHIALRFRGGHYGVNELGGIHLGCTDSEIVGTYCSDNTGPGIYVAKGYAHLNRAVCWKNGSGIRIATDTDPDLGSGFGAPPAVSINSCFLDTNNGDGVYIGAGVSQVAIVDTSFHNNSASGADAGSHITSATTNATISVGGACRFVDTNSYTTYDINAGTGFVNVSTDNIHVGGNTTSRYSSNARVRAYLGLNTYSDGDTLHLVGAGGATLSTSEGYSADALGPYHRMRKSRNASIGSNTIVQSGDVLGTLAFEGYDGTGYVPAAFLRGAVTATPGAADMPGSLLFLTTADGANSPTERLRIDHTGLLTVADAGNLAVGTSTGSKIGTSSSQKLGFWNATPVVQQVLATGASHTVDDVISTLQTIGLVKQS